MTFNFSIPTVLAMPLVWLAATSTMFTVVEAIDDSLFSVYESIYPGHDPSEYIIHDPSRIITYGDKQMIAVTGKAQEDGYNCGLETWWRKVGGKGNWKPGQCLFRTKPSWASTQTPTNDGAYWAPELDYNKKKGTLTMLYSIAEMEDDETKQSTCVGVATSTTGMEGFPDNLTWEDAGEPLTCIAKSDYDIERSAIDPSVFKGFGENAGKLFLVTGGGRIIGTELDSSTYMQKQGKWFDLEGDLWTELSSGPASEDDNWVEAAYIHPNKKEGYYYLFVNWGRCCSGVDSTYEIRVGRSENPMGPYLDKDGVDMMQGGGSKFEKTRKFVIGPGHTAIWKDGGKDYITYHYYDKRREGGSWIAEKKIKWKNGWPKVNKEKPISYFPKKNLN